MSPAGLGWVQGSRRPLSRAVTGYWKGLKQADSGATPGECAGALRRAKIWVELYPEWSPGESRSGAFGPGVVARRHWPRSISSHHLGRGLLPCF